MSNSFPPNNGDRSLPNTFPKKTPEMQGADIASRVDQLKADLERLQAILHPAAEEGTQSEEPSPMTVGKPIQEMRPPESIASPRSGDDDLVTMKVKVPRATASSGQLKTDQPDDLVTMRVKVPRGQGSEAIHGSINSKSGAPDLMTMRVKVPRSNTLDPASIGQAIAQSLDALNETIPDAVDSRSFSKSGAFTERGRTDDDESYFIEDDFVPDEEPPIGREFSLRDVFYMIRERWMIGVSLGLLFAAGFAYWMLSQPPEYLASAELLIKLKDDYVLPIKGTEEAIGAGTIDSAMEIHRKSLLSTAYLAYVNRESLTKLDGDPTPLKQEYINGLAVTAKLDPEQQVDSQIGERLFDQHYSSAQNIFVARRSGHPFLEVSYRHPDPKIAQQIANLICHSYDDFLSMNNKKTHGEVKEFLSERIKALKSKIQDAEKDIQIYRKDNNLIELDNGPNSRAFTTAETLESRIQETEVNIVKIESQLELIKLYDRNDVEQLSQQSFIAEFGPVAAVQAQLDENRQEFAKLDLKYGARWPAVIANRAERADLIDQLAKNVELAIRATENSLEKLRDEQARLRDNQKLAEQESLGVNDPVVRLKEMQSILDLDKKSFESLQNRFNEIEITEKLDRTNVEVMHEAVLPISPVIPDHNRVAQIACLIFLATFLILPIGLGFLDNRLKSFSEAEAFLGKECLGVIPERNRLSPLELGQAVLKDADSQIVESFRVILGSMDLSSQVQGPKVIVVTSAGPGEGKSFVTANLAAMLARHGRRCLILDCDLRKPSQHKLVGNDNDLGLLAWFESGAVVPANAEAAMVDSTLGIMPVDLAGNLFLLRSGGTSRNPSEIISSRNFERLLGVLRNCFDVILVDSPPVGLFPDPLFLATYAEESVFVCKHNGLNRHKIKFGLRKMERCHCEVIGVVMNQLSASRRHQYGYSYRDYGYGYYTGKDLEKYYADEDSEDPQLKV